MPLFRKTTPKRTCAKKYKRYQSYKLYLREDFSRRCGYCDESDILYGGPRGFHIDHFRPRDKFAHLENDYSNLVYACSYCNGAKSNNWPAGKAAESVVDGKGYIDPCDMEYGNQFGRASNGRILPKTDVGRYMFRQLKLGLRRHELAWMYEQLEKALQALTNELENFVGESALEEQLGQRYLELTAEFLKYKNLFQETL